MNYKKILKDSTHLIIGRAGTAILSLVSLMILSRLLTTEEMGIYSLILMVVNLALIIGLNWSDSSIVRHGREEFVNTKKINQSFWARMYIFVPIIAIISVLFIAFRQQLAQYINIDQNLILLMLVMFILNSILNFVTYIYQSTDHLKRSAYVMLSQKVFYVAFLLFALAGYFSSDITRVLIFINISFLISVLLNIFLFDFKNIMPYTFSKPQLKKIWSFSWPQLIGFPGIYVINYVDLFFIERYLELADVGTYSVAYNGFTSICSFIMIINTVFFPLIVEYRAKKDFHSLNRYFKLVPFMVLTWAAVAICGILLSNHIITILFSSKYTAAVPSFNMLLVASIFYFASICLIPIINAYDLIIYQQIINLIKAAVNILADIIFIPQMGIIGAAYATILTYATGLIITVILLYTKKEQILGK